MKYIETAVTIHLLANSSLYMYKDIYSVSKLQKLCLVTLFLINTNTQNPRII